MKYIITSICITLSIYVNAQLVFGKDQVSSNSVAVEFADHEPRGLILPWVISASSVTGAVQGTMVFDTGDYKVKFLTNSGWKDLTVINDGFTNATEQNLLLDNTSAKLAIGSSAEDDTAPGILVISDTDKALVLPKVEDPHLNIVNPSAGMIVYDPTKKMLVVFNGNSWTFWKSSSN